MANVNPAHDFRPLEASTGVPDRALMRCFLAACQACSIALTWPLWQPRSEALSPPNLPIFDSALLDWLQVPLGEALLVSLAVAVFWPRAGTIAHGALLALAMAFDQLRIQPEFVSLAILLAGTAPRRGPLLLARSHLISLWLWAGLHKFVSSGYLMETGPQLARGLFAGLSDTQALAMGTATALAELTLGVISILPLARRSTPMMAAIVHGGILLALIHRGWNSAVWPWNLALAAAGYGYFANWNGPLGAAPLPPRRSWGIWQAAAALLMGYPALFYLNLCDGYLAWCVYAANTPEAVVFDRQSPEGERLFLRAYRPLNVPFSPAVRLYEQHFRRTAQPGDRLEITDPRPLSRWQGQHQRTLRRDKETRRVNERLRNTPYTAQ